MFKYYRCEYCGRKILTEVCRYCCGINSFEHMTPVLSKKTAGKKVEKPKSPLISDKIKSHKTGILLLCLILILVLLLGYILHDAEIVWDLKENSKTDLII